jgi:hypothetical protein
MKPTLLAAALALALSPLAARAQQNVPELPAASPPARVEQRVGVTQLAVDYSSPAVKGRKIWGGLVPLDQVWRTGANATTKLIASRDFTFGGKTVPAGTYAIFTIPGKSQWTVILSSRAEGWGSNQYDEQHDVARVTVKPTPLAGSRERMTFLFSDTTDDATNLDLEWDKLRVRVPITVDTRAHVAANIDAAVANAWRPHFLSARYLLESGGDVDRALDYADRSIAIQPTWWNQWIRAQALGKKGRRADAIAAAEQALALGKGDNVFEGFFRPQVTSAIAGWK